MKILYVTNLNYIQIAGGFANDYLNDLLFYGLYETIGNDIVDSTRIDHMYVDSIAGYNRPLWGKGFSQTFLIDQDNIDRSDLENKIKNKFFDYVIYGACNKFLGGYDFISNIYDSNRIIMVDGDDKTVYNQHLAAKHPYFKREIIETDTSLRPIHFAIPEEKIRPYNDNKDKLFATTIPGVSGYLFDKEEEYYYDYYRSTFGITMKKAGWDCMRHYEIMANGCIPLFSNIDNCPPLTMTNIDKALLKECLSVFANNSDSTTVAKHILEYTKEFLTTKKLAEYILESII